MGLIPCTVCNITNAFEYFSTREETKYIESEFVCNKCIKKYDKEYLTNKVREYVLFQRNIEICFLCERQLKTLYDYVLKEPDIVDRTILCYSCLTSNSREELKFKIEEQILLEI